MAIGKENDWQHEISSPSKFNLLDSFRLANWARSIKVKQLKEEIHLNGNSI